MKPERGQIWRERDQRQERHVWIVEAAIMYVRIRTVEKLDGKGWRIKAGSREATTGAHRFEGNSADFVFVGTCADVGRGYRT